MWSIRPDTHKIDQWMVKFLLNHALPLGEKTVTAIDPPDLALFESQQLAERNHTTSSVLSTLL